MTKSKLASVLLALIVSAIASTEMQARTTEIPASYDRHDVRGYVAVASLTTTTKRVKRTKQYRRHEDRPRVPKNYALAETKIVAHPAGCPRRAFCGCGVSLHVFGKAVAAGGLAIAAEWLRFPRAEPAPGMVAARRGHVFAILETRGNGRVLAYDPNSGRHMTRIHIRSLRGYVVVNPRGGARYATAG